jgi:archaellin
MYLYRWPFLLVVFLVISFVLSGCEDERKPVPVLNIKVLADGQYELNGEIMNKMRLREDVMRIADENRRDVGHTSRVYVRITTQNGASLALKQGVIDMCMAADINSIQQTSGNE